MALSLVACGSSSSDTTTDDAANTDASQTDTATDADADASTDDTTAADTTTEKRTLRVAMECAYAPYNWTQPDNSNGAVQIKDSSDYAYGYDVMMAKYICEQLGWDLEIVKSDWESIIPAIQAGTVDVGICGQSITSDRLEMVDFTTPYYYATIVTVVPADGEYADATSVADLAGGTCTSQLNTIWYDNCLPQIPDANILPGQESAPAMIVALTSGRVDYIVTDQPTGLAAVAANPNLKLLEFTGDGAFDVSDEDINIGISVQKGNDELIDAINGVLAGLTEEDFTNWMNEAISVQPLSE
jgi:putative lysine transport system substrate-binding protein